MLDEPFVFDPRQTPSGMYFVEVKYKGVVIATGRKKHTTIEAAVSEVSAAIHSLNLESVIESNGRLAELLS